MEDKINFTEEGWVLQLILGVTDLKEVVHFLDFHLDLSLSSTFIAVTSFELLGIIVLIIEPFVDELAFTNSIVAIAQVRIAAGLDSKNFKINFDQH